MEMPVDVDTLETDDNLIVDGEKLKEISKNEGKELEIENQTGNTKPEIKKECRKRELPDWMIKNEDDKKQRKQKCVEQEVNEEIKEQCTLGKSKRKLLDEGVKVERKEEIKELPDSLPKIEIENDDKHFDLHKKAKIEIEEKCSASPRDVRTDVKDLDFDDVKEDINFWNVQQIEKETSNKNKESGSKSTTLKQSQSNDPSSQTSKMTSPDGGNELSGKTGNSRCSSGDEDSKFNDCDGKVKMALVVRQDLKMGKGKAWDNCCNATLAAYKLARQNCPQALRAWEENGQSKVIVEADNEEVLLTLLAQARDHGLVSAVVAQAPDSKTVVALGPGPVDLVDQLTGDLKKF